jgi:uncharacterized Fe-S center protein
MASKVYYMDARSTSPQTAMVAKMLTVFDAAGFDKLISPSDVVAIKIHTGEWNNSSYLRPVYARALADRVRELGGRPFVCDTTTLPYGPYASRVTELDLLTTAERNGYSPAVLGCPLICADGFMGTDDYHIELAEGYILKEAFIAGAIAAADVLIALTHFKGHPTGVIGGAIKNLGIGAQSKRGKFNVHMGGHPRYGFGASVFHPENYKGSNSDKDWRALEGICPYDLIHVTEDSIEWEREKCTNCLACLAPLSSRGIVELSETNFQSTNAAIADACLATIKAVGEGKVAFINMALDISPFCDCVNYSDMSLVPNLGVFASFDPVAIDKACIDKAIETVGIKGSVADEREVMEPGQRKFEACSSLLSGIGEEIQLNTGEIIGLGSRDYELVDVAEGRMEEFAFAPDRRLVGTRFRDIFAKIQPFPRDRFGGKGFLREEEVDLERVNAYYSGSESLETGHREE